MPDRWLYVVVRSPSEWEAELLGEALLAAGATGVEQQGMVLATYFPPPAAATEFVAELRRSLERASGGPQQLAWEWRPAEDWSREWRRGLGARRVGERLLVTPSWVVPDSRPGDLVIRIDPQMAFGTGEHASTRGVLRLLEPVIKPGAAVLDVGTGSGILAIAAAKLGAASVLAVESDPDALINARENVASNGVAGLVQLRHAAVDTTFLSGRPAAYELILANVLSSVLRPLLPGFGAALRPGGRLILGGILAAEVPELLAPATAVGLELEAEDREDEWWSGRWRRPLAMLHSTGPRSHRAPR